VNPEIWATLDIAPVRDRDAIRRAYARRLKVTNPEDDAEAFRDLRAAYEEALAALDWDWAWEDEPSEEEGDAVEAETLGDDIVTAISMEQFRLMMGGAPSGPPVFAAPPPLEGDDDHARLLDALERLVLGDPPAETAAVEAALAAVLASPALEQVAVAGQIEQRIAYLITQHAPRADALVRPAINAFRWAREGVRARYDGLVEAVLDRDADIVFRSGLLRDEGPRRTAFLALSRPLNQGPAWHDRAWPGFDAALRDVLAEIETRRTSLLADLDAGSLAHWRAHLNRVRLPVGALWLAALGPPLPALIALLAPENPPITALLVYFGGVAAVLGCAAAWSFGLAPLRRRWREDWQWRAPAWTGFGWAPASIALLVLAGFAPANLWVTAGVGLCSAALALWAVVTCEVEDDPTPGAWPLVLKLLVGQGLLVAWWGLLMAVAPAATPPPATAAFAGAVIASAAGLSSLPMLWYRWTGRPLRIALILALAGATAWIVMQLLGPHETTGGASMAATATAAIILAHRAPAGGLGSTTLGWRYRIQGFSLMLAIGGSSEFGWLRVSGLWLLAGVVVALIGALVMEKDL
jgi:hypothetical protein